MSTTGAGGLVTLTYAFKGAVPTSGSVLFVVSAGGKQYGYKLVDSSESAHFVFDFASAEQENFDEAASVGSGKAAVSFPGKAVDLSRLKGGSAALNVEGADVDECTLS